MHDPEYQIIRPGFGWRLISGFQNGVQQPGNQVSGKRHIDIGPYPQPFGHFHTDPDADTLALNTDPFRVMRRTGRASKDGLQCISQVFDPIAFINMKHRKTLFVTTQVFRIQESEFRMARM